VTAAAIHRVIEQHATACGERPAILGGDRSVTYRELNQSANVMARRLITHGFHRGGHAWVQMPVGSDLACVLLGILKAGGSYTWVDPDRSSLPHPDGVSITVGASGSEEQYLHLDTAALLRDVTRRSSPNLPVVARGTDIACILRDNEGAPVILVPHATITALLTAATPQPASWTGEPGALDLWLALITGKTAVVEVKRLDAAA